MRRDDTQQMPGLRTQEMPRTAVVRHTRRVVFATVGGALMIAGALLIPLPGPFTIPLMLLGLTILSWEFRWAKRMKYEIKARVKRLRSRQAKHRAK
ncbi:MAG: PGPGW domain-containing protein [Actinomycetota bacterium]